MNTQKTQPKRKTFSLLAVNDDESAATFHEVDGEWIEVITGVETFIWSDQDEDIYGLDGSFDVFHLVEARSGICIGRGLDREMAIESAIRSDIAYGRGGLQRVIQKTIQRYGLSPAFS